MDNVFYIQSFDRNRNIGGAYNRHIKHLPEDAWIVISDHDSNFLIPDFGIQIEDAITHFGNEFALMGCVTNRLRGEHQLHGNKFSEKFDMLDHFDIAKDRFNNYYCTIEETHGVAGVCMIFSKKTWEAVGGFKENNIACDTRFNEDVKRLKLGKIGILKGLYLFHCYRPWEKNYNKAINSVSHLIKR